MSSNALRTVPFPEPLKPVMMMKGVLLDFEWGFINSETHEQTSPGTRCESRLRLYESEIPISTPIHDADALRFSISENNKLAVRGVDFFDGLLNGHRFGRKRTGADDLTGFGIAGCCFSSCSRSLRCRGGFPLLFDLFSLVV